MNRLAKLVTSAFARVTSPLGASLPRKSDPAVSAAAKFDAALAELGAIKRSADEAAPATSQAATAAAGAPVSASALTALDGAAIAKLAQLSWDGTAGSPRDARRATALWVQAAAKGDVGSYLRVAAGLVDGLGSLPRDPAGARSMLERILRSGVAVPWAQYTLATLLLRDVVESAQTGDSSGAVVPRAPLRAAGLDLRCIPVGMRSTDPQLQRALSLLTAAAEDGSVPPAWLDLANAYTHGIGLPAPDTGRAIYWMTHAALRRDPLAAAQLAARYSAGTGGAPRDERMALSLWRVAAESGHVVAQYNVGVAYMQGYAFGGGTGVRSPQPLAADSEQKATAAAAVPISEVGGGGGGATGAVNSSNNKISSGSGTPKPAPPPLPRVTKTPSSSSNGNNSSSRDAAAALVWFTLAGNAGFPRAMMNAGTLLEAGGAGVARDTAAALGWYRRALAALTAAAADKSGGPGIGGDRSAALHRSISAVQQRIDALGSRATAAAAASGSGAAIAINDLSFADGDAFEGNSTGTK